MKSIHIQAQDLTALRDFLLDNVTGQASVVERITNGLPANHQWWRWRAVPGWLTTASVTDPEGNEVPRFRVRPGWGIYGWYGNQTSLPRSWFQYDAEGNVTAEPQYLPGIFLVLEGPNAEMRALTQAIRARDGSFPRQATVGGATIRYAQMDYTGKWVRAFRPSTVNAALTTWGVPGYTVARGFSYDDELEAA